MATARRASAAGRKNLSAPGSPRACAQRSAAADKARRTGAVRRVRRQLGIQPETLHDWVTQAEVDAGGRPGTTSDEAQRIVELEREGRKLLRANEILRTASALFAAAELDCRIR